MKEILVVQINPEMRVKLERGPAEARLVPGIPTKFLVRVENEAHTTATLHLMMQSFSERDRWLRLTLEGGGRLTGKRDQTLALVLMTSARGRREALFIADIGQGTQDMGFRAELAVLFRSD